MFKTGLSQLRELRLRIGQLSLCLLHQLRRGLGDVAFVAEPRIERRNLLDQLLAALGDALFLRVGIDKSFHEDLASRRRRSHRVGRRGERRLHVFERAGRE